MPNSRKENKRSKKKKREKKKKCLSYCDVTCILRLVIDNIGTIRKDGSGESECISSLVYNINSSSWSVHKGKAGLFCDVELTPKFEFTFSAICSTYT